MSAGCNDERRSRGREVRASRRSMRSARPPSSPLSRPYAPSCVPVSTTSCTPSASRSRTALKTSAMATLRSRPRVRGTMQKAQTSSQPSWIFTKERVRRRHAIAASEEGLLSRGRGC